MMFDLQNLINHVDGLEELSSPVTKQEIDSVVKLLPIDKAPGMDAWV